MNMAQPPKLRYELTQDAVNLLLRVIDQTQIRGVQGMKNLLALVEILQNPLNAEELEKENLERLKKKFEPEEKKDKK